MIEALPPNVLEVLGFLGGGCFLNPPEPLHRVEWLIEPSLAHAKELAWAGATGEAGEEDLTFWVELREHQAAPLVGRSSRLPGGTKTANDVYDYLGACWAKLIRHPSKPAIPREYLDLAGDVVGDLKNIALSRLLNGMSDSFWERLFQAYRSGGWPCGWSGKYPDGKLIVLDPGPRA